MRLGYHCHIPAYENNSEIRMPGYIGVFIDSLASYSESIICFMHEPLAEEIDQLGYQIKSQNVYLVSIGPHTSVPKRLVNSYKIRKKIFSYQNKLDILLIRAPTPLIHIFSKKFTVAMGLHIVSDYLAGIDHLPQPFWRKEMIRLFARWNYWHQSKIEQKGIVFAAGETIYNNLQPIVSNLKRIRNSTLSDKDIYNRKDTCENDTIILLFVGRYEKSKGLFELYETLSQLKNNRKEYKLYLVGWPEKDDSILEDLDNYAKKLGIKQLVVNLGYIQLGPELFEIYKKADICVMPTKYDMFPRTITEAMGHSLPVIATKVGSIPLRLTDGFHAILVEPGDSSALSDAINEVVSNKQLRQKLIKEGRKYSSQNTLEIQNKKMINRLENYINKRLVK
jgi:glycosyltransferase involved in cell wall biosynthesis